MLLTEAQAKKVFAGSFESRISALACASTDRGWTLCQQARAMFM